MYYFILLKIVKLCNAKINFIIKKNKIYSNFFYFTAFIIVNFYLYLEDNKYK